MSILGRFTNAFKAAVEGFRGQHTLLIRPHEEERGKWQPHDFKKQVEAYHDWVYAVVKYIAYTCASVPLRLYQRGKGGDEEVPRGSHRFYDLFREVNPWMNEFELKVHTFQYLDSTGNTYWQILPDRLGMPVEIWVLMSQYMKIVPDAQKFIKSYVLEYGSQKIRYDPEQIIHFSYPNPLDPWYGASPLRAAAYAIDADEYMKKYRLGLFKRDAIPSTALELEGKLGDKERKRLETQFNQKYGGFEKSGGLVVLSGGAKFKPLSLSPKELDFLTSLNANLDEICGIFGVPSLLLSKTEGVNRSNMEAAYYSFLRDTIRPKLTMVAEKLNEKLLPRYADKTLYCKFDDPVPEDAKQMLAQREMLLRNWVITPNEERERLGLEPVEWGDKPLVPFNIMPLGEGGGVPAEQPKSSSDSIIKPISTKRTFSDFAFPTKEERRNRWRQTLARIQPQERQMARELEKYFARQRDIILINLSKLKGYQIKEPVDFIMFALDSENELLTMLADPFWRDAAMSGALAKIGGLGLDIEWNMHNPRALAWLERKTMKIKLVNVETKERIRQILTEGFQEGLGAPEIADNIKEDFKKFASYRAERIARTEIVGASNYGGHDVLEEANIEKHAWMTAQDGDVRDSHLTCEAEGWIPLHDIFSNGLRYPGDEMGAASEVINCRCAELP